MFWLWLVGKFSNTDFNCSDFISDASVQLLLNVVSVIVIDKVVSSNTLSNK